jgi:hypothetical protein
LSEKKSLKDLEEERVKKESESVIKNLRKQDTAPKETSAKEQETLEDNMNNMSSSRRKNKKSENLSKKDSNLKHEIIQDVKKIEETSEHLDEKENHSDQMQEFKMTMSNKVEDDDDDYVSYSKLKESRKTLSRPSNISNHRDIMKNFKADGEIGEENINSDNHQADSSKDLIEMEKNHDHQNHSINNDSNIGEQNSLVEDIQM